MLEAGGDVDRVAEQALALGGSGHGHHLSGVDPDPVLETNAARAFQALVDLLQPDAHVPGGVERSVRVVAVGHRQAEHGHDRVADELLHRAARALDLGPHTAQVGVDHLLQTLSVEALSEGRRADQVGEQDRYDLPLLERDLRLDRLSAFRAEASAIVERRAAAGTAGRELGPAAAAEPGLLGIPCPTRRAAPQRNAHLVESIPVTRSVSRQPPAGRCVGPG